MFHLSVSPVCCCRTVMSVGGRDTAFNLQTTPPSLAFRIWMVQVAQTVKVPPTRHRGEGMSDKFTCIYIYITVYKIWYCYYILYIYLYIYIIFYLRALFEQMTTVVCGQHVFFSAGSLWEALLCEELERLLLCQPTGVSAAHFGQVRTVDDMGQWGVGSLGEE